MKLIDGMTAKASEDLKPLIQKHDSLSELAHEAIRERILSGYFKPGEWLRQEELSQQLGVSHTPVRGALDRPVADGDMTYQSLWRIPPGNCKYGP